MNRRCLICSKPIVLIPTAAERAAKDVSGKTAQYYLDLFTIHAECQLKKRSSEAAELIRQNRNYVL